MEVKSFRVGDRVRFAGTEGVVIQVDETMQYEVRVEFSDDLEKRFWFRSDGKHPTYNDRLTLIERPKRMVKKTLYKPIMSSHGRANAHEGHVLFLAKESALGFKSSVIGVVAVEVEMVSDE